MTGFGLATAAGLNACIPMLLLGLLGRFTGLIHLPPAWSWLENGWLLTIVGVLLAIEIVADKIPALDSVNDAIQTFVRPTSAASSLAPAPLGRRPPSPIRATSPAPGSGCRLPSGGDRIGGSPDQDRRTPSGQRGHRRSGCPGVEHHRGTSPVRDSFVAILLPALVLIVLAGLIWAAVRLSGRRRRRRRAARTGTGEVDR